MKYKVVYRSPDNSDGIYQGEHMVVSAYAIWKAGYAFHYVICYSQAQLARLVKELG